MTWSLGLFWPQGLMLVLYLYRARKGSRLALLASLYGVIAVAEGLFPLWDASLSSEGQVVAFCLVSLGLGGTIFMALRVAMRGGWQQFVALIILLVSLWAAAFPLFITSVEMIGRFQDRNLHEPQFSRIHSARMDVESDLHDVLRAGGFEPSDVTLRDEKPLINLRILLNQDMDAPWQSLGEPVGGAIGLEITEDNGRTTIVHFNAGYIVIDPNGKYVTFERQSEYCRLFGMGPCGTALHDLYGYCAPLISCWNFVGHRERSPYYAEAIRRAKRAR